MAISGADSTVIAGNSIFIFNTNLLTCASSQHTFRFSLSVGARSVSALLEHPNLSMAPPPPPPPPGPPPPPPAPTPGDGGNTGDATAALFAEINNLGADGIRAGLSKGVRGPVNDEKPVEKKPAPAPVAKVEKKVTSTKPPVFELQGGKKWAIEYQKDNQECVVEVASTKQGVYVFKCEKSVIQVKGKPNSITIDSCKKVDLVFENALSQVEIINSDSIRVQCTGKAPSINIDGCTSVTYFLSAESVESSHIVTSKSAAINIIRPDPKDPDDIIETPVPEQFLTSKFPTFVLAHDVITATNHLVYRFQEWRMGDRSGVARRLDVRSGPVPFGELSVAK